LKEKSESEWERILSNPDNVIVSDSLREQLDSTGLEPRVSSLKVARITCYLKFKTHQLEGDLISYASDAESWTYVIAAPPEKLVNILYDDNLQLLQITDDVIEGKMSLEMLPEDETPSLSWTREDEQNALLSLVIKKSSE
jgi:hypothetical protein